MSDVANNDHIERYYAMVSRIIGVILGLTIYMAVAMAFLPYFRFIAIQAFGFRRERSGTAVTSVGEEVTLVELSAMPSDYIVDGYIDLSAMDEGDEVELIEYIDGKVFNSEVLSGRQPQPIFRVPSRYFAQRMSYRFAVRQNKGTPKTVGYAFIVRTLV